MKKSFFLSNLLLGFLSFLVVDCYAQYAPKKPQAKPNLQQVNNQFAMQSLRFTENKGQVADLDGKLRPDILFTAQNEGVKLFLTANGIQYQFRRDFKKPEQANAKPGMPSKSEIEEVDSTQFYRLDLSLKGANPQPKVIKEGAGPDVENFFLAHCPEGITGVKNYNRITYKEVYPNIDWVVYVKEGMLEYDFVVRPGGNIEDIKLQYNGAENLDLDKLGALHITTPLGKVTEQKPFSFQQEGREVTSSFVLEGNTIGFEVPEYNDNKVLTIDPSIVWATYYGGTGNEYEGYTTVDAFGNVYLAGTTESTSGISTSGSFQRRIGGQTDAFLAKFDSDGARLWATYYGGSGGDYGSSVAIDGNSNVFLVSSTNAGGLASNGFQNTPAGKDDALLVKFNKNGVRIWATYYGGSESEVGRSCSVDRSGNIYLAGSTQSSSGIASGGYQNTYGGNDLYGQGDAFMVKFNSAGSRLWATYYGGAKSEDEPKCMVDSSENVFIVGYTNSISGIASGGFQNSLAGSYDAFLAKFSENGSHIWSTYYGGSDFEFAKACSVDPFGNVFIAGRTSSNSGIAFNGFQNSRENNESYIVKFNSEGSRLWGTYYGGPSASDGPCSTIADALGNVYLMGTTRSATGISDGGFQNSYRGDKLTYDAFIVKFNSSGSRLWGSYFGGNRSEQIFSSALDGSGNFFISGQTISTSGIAINGFQNTYGGGTSAIASFGDAFLAKITEAEIAPDADNDGVPDASDCAPNDATKYQTANLYKDTDNDGYDGGQENVCYGATIPTGYKNTSLGKDCDDADNTIAGTRTWYKDSDDDGYSDGTTLIQCFQPEVFKLAANLIALSGDCNETNGSVHPGAPEICDGLDNDCDGIGDEGTEVTWYKDADNDGYSDGTTLVRCFKPADYQLAGNLTATSGDCNDANGAIHPGATELCDGLDNDCNDQTDEGIIPTWYKDADNDGYSDGNTLVQCTKPDGYKLPAGLTALSGDCDDAKSSIHPGAPELCDGLDNDCDAQTDEGCPVGTAWYFDYDKDGYGNAAKVVYSVTKPYKYVANPDDCKDWDAAYHPGATELCDGKDNDCDGLVDEGCPGLKTWYRDGDRDGYGNAKYTKTSVGQPWGFVANADDCRDWDANYYPGHGCPPVTGITGTDGNTTMPKAMVETSVEIQVFPNPARDEITVTLNGFEVGKKLELVLMQTDGRPVASKSIGSFEKDQQVRFNLNQIRAGYYILHVRQNGLKLNKKVIIF